MDIDRDELLTFLGLITMMGIKPILDVLSRTFLSNYSPSQELSVDEAMIKYKGHIRGKVRMPNKSIKAGFKVWCCCCSCCGYLCTFQVYEGKPIDPATGKSTSEKGMVARVVKDLVGPLSGLNHVVYMDNYFTSGPLVEELAQDKIYVAGTIKQRAVGFPEGKPMVLIENRSDTGYVLFFSFFIMPLIMPTYYTNTIASCLICLPKSC